MNRNIYILLLLTAIFSSCSKDEFVSNDDDTSRNTTSRIVFSVPDSVYIFNDSELATRGLARIKQNSENLTIFEENDEFSLIGSNDGSQIMKCKIGVKEYEIADFTGISSPNYYKNIYNSQNLHLIFNQFSLQNGNKLEDNTEYFAVYPDNVTITNYNEISLNCLEEQTCVANQSEEYYCNNYDYDIFVAKGRSRSTINALHNEEGKEIVKDIVPLELTFQLTTTKYITTLAGIPSDESVDYVEYEFEKLYGTYAINWNPDWVTSGGAPGDAYGIYRVFKNPIARNNDKTICKVYLKSSKDASSYGANPYDTGDFYKESNLVVAVTFLDGIGYYFENNPVKIKAHTTKGNVYEGKLGGDYEAYGHVPWYIHTIHYTKDEHIRTVYNGSKVMLKKTNN